MSFKVPSRISGLRGHYMATDVELDANQVLTQWNDVSGQENHVNFGSGLRGNILRSDPKDPNASDQLSAGSRSFPFLFGDVNAGCRFPVTVMNEIITEYTLFHVSRHTGTQRERIFNGVDNNWLSGFHSGKSGVAFHGAWITPETDVHGSIWVVSTDQRNIYRSNGVERGTITNGTSAHLSINHSNNNSEYSDWAVAEVIIYDRNLTTAEMEDVEAYLDNKYRSLQLTVPSTGAISGSMLTALFADGTQGARYNYPVSRTGPLGAISRGNEGGNSRPISLSRLLATATEGGSPFGQLVKSSIGRSLVGGRLIGMIASGGDISDITIDGVEYRVHTFTNVGSSTFEVTDLGDSTGEVEYLVVGGGGGGASRHGGGGGAGGLIQGSLSISPQSYSVSIGNGGSGAPSGGTTRGDLGEDSSLFGLIAIGGGFGNGDSNIDGGSGGSGGSGGGARGNTTGSGGSGQQPNSTNGGLGNDGGGVIGNGTGGGGGGAMQVGETGNGDGSGGTGGDGIDLSGTFGIAFGENGFFAGGGGGGGREGPEKQGGLGGGGNGGATNPSTDIDGMANTGGGGGGGGMEVDNSANRPGGSGGSGIVIIRFRM